MARTKQTARKSTGGKAAAPKALIFPAWNPKQRPKPAEDGSDVRDRLEDALDGATRETQAVFSYFKTFHVTPNPALEIAQFGVVGLPLPVRDVDSIKSFATSPGDPVAAEPDASEGDARQTSWEVNANQVSFANAAWTPFMEKKVVDVCQALGTDRISSKPRWELGKLLLSETGSEDPLDNFRTANTIATIVAILPSKFTGGNARFSHGDLTTEFYDSSARSSHDTTILAWHTGATTQIDPITSGFRLALVYNLIHTTTKPLPSIAVDTSFVEEVSSILLNWEKARGQRAPNKIVYLLQDDYSNGGRLRANSLKGQDAQLVGTLRLLCSKHGFDIDLATAKCDVSGIDPDDYDSYEYERMLYVGGDGDRDLSVVGLVDLNGKAIARKVEYEEEDETIPLDLGDAMDDSGSSESRSYSRTVLVIWPSKKQKKQSSSKSDRPLKKQKRTSELDDSEVIDLSGD